MKIPRRQFLTAVPAGLIVASAAGQVPSGDLGELQSEADWQAVRRKFPMAHDLIYFNAGGLGPAPQAALDAVCETTRALQVHTEHGHRLIEETRPALARFMGVDTSEVAFTRNATEGNSTVASGLRLSAGDEVILDSHAHQGGSVCWMTRQNYDAIRVRSFDPVCECPHVILDRIAKRITSKTKVIQVSHVTAPTGIRMPVCEIAKLAHDHKVWFHIDGAQSLGMFPCDLRKIGCDSFASSGHKWLCGPTGTGVLYVKQDRLDEIKPTDVGAYGDAKWQVPTELELVAKARRFECGTRDAATVVGLGKSMGLLEQIGMDRVADRGLELAACAVERLARIEGVEVLSPSHPALRSSMVSFRYRQMPCNKVFDRLRQAGLRCRPVREQGLNAIRVSTHVFNSQEEVDRLVTAVEQLDRV
jgi:selenocysteine lyase/cysteine desulfurase